MTCKLFLGIPGAALYRLLRPETNQRLLHFADVLRSAHFICSSGLGFKSNQRKEMHI